MATCIKSELWIKYWPKNPEQTTKRFMEKAKRENVCSANLLVEKHRKAIQSKQEIGANSVVLGYAKYGALPIIIVKTLEHKNWFYKS